VISPTPTPGAAPGPAQGQGACATRAMEAASGDFASFFHQATSISAEPQSGNPRPSSVPQPREKPDPKPATVSKKRGSNLPRETRTDPSPPWPLVAAATLPLPPPPAVICAAPVLESGPASPISTPDLAVIASQNGGGDAPTADPIGAKPVPGSDPETEAASKNPTPGVRLPMLQPETSDPNLPDSSRESVPDLAWTKLMPESSPDPPGAPLPKDQPLPLAPELAADPVSSPAPQAGISAAYPLSAMQLTPQMNENSGLAEQVLPTLSAILSSEKPGDRRRPAEAAPSPHNLDLWASGTEAAMTLATQAPDRDLTVEKQPGFPSITHAQALERSIQTASLELRRTDAASLSMVLRPDANLQLTLHLKWQQGHLEARVVVEHGDGSALASDWGQLQQRLTEQGVRLAPLLSNSQTATNFGREHHPFERQEHSPGPRSENPNLTQSKTPSRRSASKPAPTSDASEWWA
jgi:hypothetical protein